MEESRFYRLIRPLIPASLRPLALRYQEALSYLVFGVLTTLVNLLIFYPLSRGISYLIANVVAWIGAVVFAFFTNKAFVFEDHDWSAGTLFRQGAAFAAARLLSLGMEELILLIFVERMGLNADITKLIAQVLVVIANYVFSKLWIFRKRKIS